MTGAIGSRSKTAVVGYVACSSPFARDGDGVFFSFPSIVQCLRLAVILGVGLADAPRLGLADSHPWPWSSGWVSACYPNRPSALPGGSRQRVTACLPIEGRRHAVARSDSPTMIHARMRSSAGSR